MIKQFNPRRFATGIVLSVGLAVFFQWERAPISADGAEINSSSTAGWMGRLHKAENDLDTLTLRDICIPGTHDSGAYQVLGGSMAKLASRWVVTQKLDLLEQLDAGARKLDLRVLKIRETDNKHLPAGLYLHHGGYATVSLEDALEQIATYLASEAARTEAVMLEFSHFHGFSKGRGKGSDAIEFIATVESALNPHLYQRTKATPPLIDLPIRELKGKALFLLATGELFDGSPESNAVHPLNRKGLAVYDRYSNCDLTDEMIADQGEKFSSFASPEKLFQLCWTLTPQKSLRVAAGVKKLAGRANGTLSETFADAEQPFGSPNPAGRIVNVINVDFFGVPGCRVLETCEAVMRNSGAWPEPAPTP